MRPVFALGVCLLAASAAFAAPARTFVLQGPEIPSAEGTARIGTQLICEGDEMPTADLVALLVSELAGGGKLRGSGTPVSVNDNSCPSTNTCECGVPTFDFSFECNPGVNTCKTRCGHTICPEGKYIRVRVCPCEGTGCSDTWSNWYCGDWICGECDMLCL